MSPSSAAHFRERIERKLEIARACGWPSRSCARAPCRARPWGSRCPGRTRPSSNSRSDSFMAFGASPAMTGVIGLSLAPVLNPSRLQPVLEELRVGPELVDELRFFEQHVQRGETRRGDRRRMRRREEKRPPAMMKELDQAPAAGDVAAERADGLRQRADLHIDAAVQPEMIDRAAPVLSKHAARMRIVDHHDAAVLFGESRTAPAARRGRRPC